jgi:DNA processing protein
MEPIKYWVALNKVPQLGTVRFGKLEAYFGDLEHAWNASLGEVRAAELESKAASEVVAARSRISPDAEMEKLRQAGVKAINWHHTDYPPRLKEISDLPPVLYYKGNLLPADERAVAVVGTRSPTTYGREAAARLTADLARSGITIASGMALGIDGVAHRAALDNGGRTIAVVPTAWTLSTPKSTPGCSSAFRSRVLSSASCPLEYVRTPATSPGATG